LAYLLDSVAVLLWWIDVDRLGKRARMVIESTTEPLVISAVSVWEIANKNRIGKLDAVQDFGTEFSGLVERDGFVLLDVTAAHALRAGYLPGSHRDPFDRLLAGQALVEDMTVLTNDPEIANFGCKVLW
jgi:PIN domain nuclease of toxin-antitoxin system